VECLYLSFVCCHFHPVCVQLVKDMNFHMSQVLQTMVWKASSVALVVFVVCLCINSDQTEANIQPKGSPSEKLCNMLNAFFQRVQQSCMNRQQASEIKSSGLFSRQ